MVEWARLKDAVSDHDCPTPFYLLREIVADTASHVTDVMEVVDYLFQVLSTDSANTSRLKALQVAKHIAAKVTPFRVYLRSHPIAPLIKSLTRSSFALKRVSSPSITSTLSIATLAAEILHILGTPDEETESEARLMEEKIMGIGRIGRPDFRCSTYSGVSPGVVSEIVSDFRVKGVVSTLGEAGRDVAEMVGDGLVVVADLLRGSRVENRLPNVEDLL